MNLGTPVSWNASFLHAIHDLGQPPVATPELRFSIRLLVWMGGLMSAGGLLWGIICLTQGLTTAAIVPFGYVLLTVLNVAVFARTGRFRRARLAQLTASLVLPFVFQWLVGGFWASGAVMLWSLLALVGSLTFSRPRETLGAMGVFVVLTLVSGLIDPAVAEWAGRATPDPRTTTFLVINICLVTLIVFGLTSFLDQRRRRDNQALRDANHTISALNADLSRANDAKSAFFANISHELRTPLNAVIGYAEMLNEVLEDDDALRDTVSIHRAGSHLLGLINQILDLSKIESGTMQLEDSLVHLPTAVREAVDVVRPQLQATGNELQLHLEGDAEYWGDGRKIRQILINLLGNAVKFTHEGRIDVTIAVTDAGLTVVVADTGIGMDSEALGRVRRPFQQADPSTTRRYEGTGLGLSLVDQFAEMMGGTLVLESESGVGTTVTVLLPHRRPLAVAS